MDTMTKSESDMAVILNVCKDNKGIAEVLDEVASDYADKTIQLADYDSEQPTGGRDVTDRLFILRALRDYFNHL